MVQLGTQEWLDEYRRRVNASVAYRDAARTWEGELAYVFEAEPERSWPETRCSLVDLRSGECRNARLVDERSAHGAAFVISAPYTRWKQVLRGELDPIQGMMQGKLRLRGDLPAVVRHVRAAKELVTIASEIPTEFPDEQ